MDVPTTGRQVPMRNPPGMPQLRGPSKWYCRAVADSSSFHEQCDGKRKNQDIIARRKAAADMYTARGAIKRHPKAGDRAGAALDQERSKSMRSASQNMSTSRHPSQPPTAASTPPPATDGDLDTYRAFMSDPNVHADDERSTNHGGMSDLDLGDCPTTGAASSSEHQPANNESITAEASPMPPPLRLGTVPPSQMRNILSDTEEEDAALAAPHDRHDDGHSPLSIDDEEEPEPMPPPQHDGNSAAASPDEVELSPASVRPLVRPAYPADALQEGKKSNAFREARLAEGRRAERAKVVAARAEAARRAMAVTRIVTTVAPSQGRSSSRQASASPNDVVAAIALGAHVGPSSHVDPTTLPILPAELQDEHLQSHPAVPELGKSTISAGSDAERPRAADANVVIEAIMTNAATAASRSRYSIAGPSATTGHNSGRSSPRVRSRSPSVAMRVSRAGSVAGGESVKPLVAGSQVSLASVNGSRRSSRSPALGGVIRSSGQRRAPAAVPKQWSAVAVHHDAKATGSIAAASQRQSPDSVHGGGHHVAHHHHQSVASSRSVSEALHDSETHAATFHRPHLAVQPPTHHVGKGHGETGAPTRRGGNASKPPHSAVDGEGDPMSPLAPVPRPAGCHGETEAPSHHPGHSKPAHSRIDGDGDPVSPLGPADGDRTAELAPNAEPVRQTSTRSAGGSSSNPASPHQMSWEMTF